MDIIKSYIKKNLKLYWLLIVFIFIFVLIFYLYNLPFEALFYSGSLCFLAALITSIIDFNNYRKSYIYLKHLESNILNSMEDLPKSLDIRVEYYQKIIQ